MKLPSSRSIRCLAFIQLDIAVAIVILGLIFIPLSVTSSAKLDLARRHHFEAVALNLIDGEIDVLLAGEIKKYKLGNLSFINWVNSISKTTSHSTKIFIGYWLNCCDRRKHFSFIFG